MEKKSLKNFKTPEINDKVIAFCHSISTKSEPQLIKVIPAPNARLGFCGDNVNKQIIEYGGKFEYGWIIWYMPNIVFEAEAHSIWIDVNGEKHDITPHEEETKGNILFLPDDENIEHLTKMYNKFPLNRNQSCTNSPLVKEYLALVNKASSVYFEKGNSGFPIEEAISAVCSRTEVNRFKEIITIFGQKVGRNEMCPCQSGIKYKKCCI